MTKKRFVDWDELKLHLPVMICGDAPKTEEALEGLIDLVEEECILDKAAEIKLKRLKLIPLSAWKSSQAMREARISGDKEKYRKVRDAHRKKNK